MIKLKSILEPVNTSLECNLYFLLQERSAMFSAVRRFFEARNVLEVDCPSLSLFSSLDAHIEVMKVDLFSNKTGYLHTSPEYGMKRLLSLVSQDIYQMSHVFRNGDLGKLHNPEFTMVEWYRIGMDYDHFINETLQFISLFLGDLSYEKFSYIDLFQKHLEIHPLKCTREDLLKLAREKQLSLSDEMKHADKDTLLQVLMNILIEPFLGKRSLCVVKDYPPSQAALAKIAQQGTETIAKRFEIYYQGIELANGYHELTDASEQRERFKETNQKRHCLGKEMLPIDENFLQALEKGLPDCCGVAVGFDRLMMLRLQKDSIAEALLFPWPHA